MTRPTANPGDIILLARHTPSASAWLRLRSLGDQVLLLEVLPGDGPLPDCSDLLGPHLSQAAARRAVLSRLRSPRRDLLSRVLLSQEAQQMWEVYAASVAAPALLAAGISPDQIPDKLAEQQTDGSLMIYVEAAGRRLGMGVPAGHWRWMRRE